MRLNPSGGMSSPTRIGRGFDLNQYSSPYDLFQDKKVNEIEQVGIHCDCVHHCQAFKG